MKSITSFRSILLSLFFLPVVGYTQNIITTVAGGGTGGDGGLAVNAWLDDVYDVYADDTGNFYIVELSSIRKVDHATGIIKTVAGTGVPGYSGDGGPADQAKLYGAVAIAFDKNGDYYIADNGAHCIRKVDAATNIITTVAGNGTFGNSGDGGPATSAQLGFPNDIALDGAGNLYIADERYVIRRVDKQTGVITTVAGNGVLGTWSNGQTALSAQLGSIRGICVDKAGNIFLADLNNHRIGKIDPSGILTTYCGTGQLGNTGEGGPAVNADIGAGTKVRVDDADNIFFTDYNVVKFIAAGTGILTHIAGSGLVGPLGDGGPALQATLNAPTSACLDGANNLFIADKLNYRIRRVAGPLNIKEEAMLTMVRPYPNPSVGGFTFSSSKEIKKIEVRSVTGELVYQSNFKALIAQIDLTSQPDGMYVANVISDVGVVSERIIIHH